MAINSTYQLIDIISALLGRLMAEDYMQSADESRYDGFVYDEDLIPAIRLAEQLRELIEANDHWL